MFTLSNAYDINMQTYTLKPTLIRQLLGKPHSTFFSVFVVVVVVVGVVVVSFCSILDILT